MNLAEEFTLLAYADDGTPVTDGTHLDNGLGGALLLDLALAGRVDVRDKRVVVLDTSPTGDDLLDDALGRIADEPKPRRAGTWVTKLSKNARPRVLGKLVADGVLRVEQDKVLGIFPRKKYPSADDSETDILGRIRAAVLGAGEVDARTGAICSLVAATDLDRKVLADLDRRKVKARLKEIGDGQWAAAAVKKTIEDIQAAVMVAIVASTTAGTAGSAS